MFQPRHSTLVNPVSTEFGDLLFSPESCFMAGRVEFRGSGWRLAGPLRVFAICLIGFSNRLTGALRFVVCLANSTSRKEGEFFSQCFHGFAVSHAVLIS